MTDVLVIGGVFREVLEADTAPRPRYGGSGLTASIAAARVGAKVTLASYVGQDDEEAVRAELELAGVDDSAVVTLAGASGTFLFPSSKGGRHPWPMYRPAETLPDTPPSAPDAHVTVVFGIPDLDPILDGWLGGGDRGTTLIWDRQGWLSKSRNADAVRGLDASERIYLANEDEAMVDTALPTLDAALSRQPPASFGASVIKRGAAGVVVFQRTPRGVSRTLLRSFFVRASTSIGSGDVFAGALAARYALGGSLVDSARWGNAAAAVSLEDGNNLLKESALARIRALLGGERQPRNKR